MVLRVRCANCRSAVAVTLVWAARDTCPSCLAPLPAGKFRREPLGDPQMRSATGAPQGVDAAGGAPGAGVKHLAAVGRTLCWADESAARGDYAGALRWVETVEALGDPRPHEYETKRRFWRGALDVGSETRAAS